MVKEPFNVNKSIKIRLIILFMALIPFLFTHCGTEKNTTVTRFYHNLTSYYNILFNAKESYYKGLTRYSEAFQYDYTRILPLFINGNQKLTADLEPQMERTIDKCSKLIRLHSISAKPEALKGKRKMSKEEKEYYNKSEFNKYVDDAYLLMGKAYFWMMEYGTASKLLQHTSSEFKDEHIRREAQIWLSRCYVELGDFREAGEVLAGLEKTQSLPEGLTGDFFVAYVDYHIRQEQYKEAIPYLEEAIEYTDEKEDEVRYAFILAQIYEETDKHKEAFSQYELVINKRPGYKMEFNARLRRATLSMLTDRGSDKVKRELRQMLRDDKNEDYLDKIYYALGEIALEEDNLSQALDFYKQSIAHNTDRENQKGLAYLSVADIYFQNKKYSNAQAYYDSAVTTIESDYPGYSELYTKTQHLTKLVNNLNTIEKEDSLQKVAKMDTTERNKLISRLIQRREEGQAEIDRQQEQANNQADQSAQNPDQRSTGGEWYFYSSTAIQRGEKEFKGRWGNRELEDNWRISSKSQADFADFQSEDQPTQAQNPEQQEYSSPNKQFYIENLPLTDSAMEASHKKIQEAYFNLGKIYMNDLDNPAKAIEAFQTLNERYSETSFKLPAYYNIYKLYREKDNAAQAERYKRRILNEFPESNHAKVLSNPDYFKELETQRKEVQKLYSKTLELYRNNQYGEVLGNCQLAKEQFEDTTYLSRFEYLEALTIGQTRDIVSFRDRLQSLVDNYPRTEVSRQADNILSYLQETEIQQINKKFVQNRAETEKQEEHSPDTGKTDTLTSGEKEQNLYKFDKEEPYYFVIIANPEEIDIDRLRFDLINFNLDYFLQKDYSTESREFNEFYNLVAVKNFEDYATAKKYYELVNKREESVFSEIGSDEYRYFFISVKNYLTLLDKKSIIEYINFFKEEVL